MRAPHLLNSVMQALYPGLVDCISHPHSLLKNLSPTQLFFQYLEFLAQDVRSYHTFKNAPPSHTTSHCLLFYTLFVILNSFMLYTIIFQSMTVCLLFQFNNITKLPDYYYTPRDSLSSRAHLETCLKAFPVLSLFPAFSIPGVLCDPTELIQS